VHALAVHADLHCDLRDFINIVNESDLLPEILTMIKFEIKKSAQLSRFSQLLYTRLALIWPFSDRDTVIEAKGVDILDQNTIVIVAHNPPEAQEWKRRYGDSVEPVPEIEGVTRMQVYPSGAIIRVLNPSHIVVSGIVCADPKLSVIPPALINFFARNLMHMGVDMIRKQMDAVRNSVFGKRYREKPQYYAELEARQLTMWGKGHALLDLITGKDASATPSESENPEKTLDASLASLTLGSDDSKSGKNAIISELHWNRHSSTLAVLLRHHYHAKSLRSGMTLQSIALGSDYTVTQRLFDAVQRTFATDVPTPAMQLATSASAATTAATDSGNGSETQAATDSAALDFMSPVPSPNTAASLLPFTSLGPAPHTHAAKLLLHSEVHCIKSVDPQVLHCGKLTQRLPDTYFAKHWRDVYCVIRKDGMYLFGSEYARLEAVLSDVQSILQKTKVNADIMKNYVSPQLVETDDDENNKDRPPVVIVLSALFRAEQRLVSELKALYVLSRKNGQFIPRNFLKYIIPAPRLAGEDNHWLRVVVDQKYEDISFIAGYNALVQELNLENNAALRQSILESTYRSAAPNSPSSLSISSSIFESCNPVLATALLECMKLPPTHVNETIAHNINPAAPVLASSYTTSTTSATQAIPAITLAFSRAVRGTIYSKTLTPEQYMPAVCARACDDSQSATFNAMLYLKVLYGYEPHDNSESKYGGLDIPLFDELSSCGSVESTMFYIPHSFLVPSWIWALRAQFQD